MFYDSLPGKWRASLVHDPTERPLVFKCDLGSSDIGSFYTNFAPSVPPHAPLVEVGVWEGDSVIRLAQIVRTCQMPNLIHAVDTFCGGPGMTGAMDDYIRLNGGTLLPLFKENLKRAGVEDIVVPLAMPSTEAARTFAPDTCGLVFIDAAHDYENVKADITAWLSRVRPGGILAGHDYSPDYPGVARAVDELVPGRLVNGRIWRIVK